MERRRIIKQGGVVCATHEDGSIDPGGKSSMGLFVGDTRFLSRFQLYVNGLSPVLLGSTEEAMHQAGFLHTNPDLTGLPARSLGIMERITIENGVVSLEVGVINWTPQPAEVELSMDIDADFYDSFEARGVKREMRGQALEPSATPHTLDLGYVGLDDARRTLHIDFDPAMDRYENGRVFFPVSVQANSYKIITLTLHAMTDAPEGADHVYTAVKTGPPQPDWFDKSTDVTTSNENVQELVNRSRDDLRILLTEYPGYWIPSAGLPRFSVPFGRDSMFTGLETLVWNPRVLHDVLYFLAEVQGKDENPFTYEQPGKIMHELHTGELARLKEIPFGMFYGSVDSTVLFLMAAAEYVAWTGDIELFRRLRPNLEAARKWIQDYGDIDGSGYVQYKAHTAPKMASAALTVGLFNQGWKDSANAVSYSDGTQCQDHPVALAEVQGYLYRALQLWGTLYQAMPPSEGMRDEGEKLLARAAELKRKFNEEFWMPEKQFYAMALDGHHRQVDIITSNPGHCLWTGLIDEEHAEAMARVLVADPMASAWGIRSMANTEKAYNPLSYHNGSVWPFENTLIGAGLKSYGFVAESDTVFDLLLDAAAHFEYGRWPEVYTGVSKSQIGVLSLQPDASRPQAWSAGAMYLWLQTWLGLSPRPFSRHVDVRPSLPEGIEQLTFRDLSVADAHISLRMVRTDDGTVQLHVLDNPDGLDVTIRPIVRGQMAQRVEEPISEAVPVA
jgi:glycogen debranching enzyme